ncbi:MAG: hypothetical protein AAB480_00750 [Patescibacteria group bacterium]
MSEIQSFVTRYRVAFAAFAVGAVVAGFGTWAVVPKTTVVHEARPTANWQPSFCATFLSKDNVPLAVCSDRYYPTYGISDGYLGLLEGCVVSGRIRGCKPATL